nr:c-type cytochrome [Leptothoe spongobia]
MVISLWLNHSPIAWAEPASELFEAHCAGCHPNGANIIRRGKNLKQKALNRHGYTSADKIESIIAHGKGLMSAYGEQLSDDQIHALANYVLEQAAINWKPST